MINVETTLTNKDVNILTNMVNQQLTILQMTDKTYYHTDAYKTLTELKEKLTDLNLEIYK